MIITLAARGAQLVLAAIVLALSVVLVNNFGPGHAPSLLDYGAFCGGASLIIAVVGIVACFFEALQGIIILILDGLATFFLLAGGLAFAISIKAGSCGDNVYTAKKYFLPSLKKSYNTDNVDTYEKRFTADTISRCRMVQADTAMIWFLFAAFLATTALSFASKSRGRSIV